MYLAIKLASARHMEHAPAAEMATDHSRNQGFPSRCCRSRHRRSKSQRAETQAQRWDPVHSLQAKEREERLHAGVRAGCQKQPKGTVQSQQPQQGPFAESRVRFRATSNHRLLSLNSIKRTRHRTSQIDSHIQRRCPKVVIPSTRDSSSSDAIEHNTFRLSTPAASKLRRYCCMPHSSSQATSSGRSLEAGTSAECMG
jgi:hypothetical protein